jgi:hypothetical protein
LNACRSLRFGATGAISSKLGGGEWVLEHQPDADVVVRAMARHRGEEAPLTREEAAEFVSRTIERLRRLS